MVEIIEYLELKTIYLVLDYVDRARRDGIAQGGEPADMSLREASN